MPLFFIAVAAFAVFGASMGHEFLLNWDDPGYVTRNEAVRAITWDNIKRVFSSFYVGNYAPLQIMSYMFDYALWGERAAGFIFSNIVFHAGSGMLFYAILVRLSLARLPALFAVLFFMLHPVQVESVVWISQRKNVLCLFFFLCSLLLYLRWYDSEAPGRRLAYVLSVLFFIAALLVKSVAVILPLILVVHDLCYPHGKRFRQRCADKLPYFLAALVIGAIALLTQSAAYGGGGRTGFHGGSVLATIFTMLPVFVTYLRLVLYPAGLSVVYAPPVKTGIDAEVMVAAAVLALLVTAGVLLYRRHRPVFFWYAVIALGFLPVSQIVPLVTLMNDRYLYFPMLGVAACFGYLCESILPPASRHRWFAALLCCLVIAGYALVAHRRAAVWQNSMTLWQDAVAKQPHSAVAWFTLGELYEKEGRYQEAIASEERAQTSCRGVECRLVLRKLAELYLHENSIDKARLKVAALQQLFPDAAEGHALAGHLSYQSGKLAEAESSYLQALRLEPRLTAAAIALGNVYLATGRPALALEKFTAARLFARPDAELAYSMSCAAALLGNRRLALDYLDEALRLGYNKPDLLRTNRELALLWGDREFIGLLEQYFPAR